MKLTLNALMLSVPAFMILGFLNMVPIKKEVNRSPALEKAPYSLRLDVKNYLASVK